MPRGRTRTAIDAARLSSLAQRPGIDPRINLTLGVVTQLGFDAVKGIYADVQFMPTGETETCLVAASYAGGGFGMWAPPREQDTVLVALPNGDPNMGPVIIARLWNSGDPPSADFKAAEQQDGSDVPTDDFVLRVAPKQKLVIRTSAAGGSVDIKVEGDGTASIECAGAGDITIKQSGSGNVNILVPDSKNVFIGDTAGTEPIPLGQTLQTFLGSVKTYLDTHTHNYIPGTLTATPTTPPIVASPTVPTITSQKGRVK
jgi:hypothetical protein